MSTITTRAGKGSPLTNNEVDANFTNLNTDKAELSGAAFTGAITTTSTVDGRDVATDGTKLDGIEASADVTDTTNVTAAGALMDSEVTNLAQVKAFDSSDYATAAQGTTADAALPKSGGAMTGAITTNSTFDGRDVATDGTKLDGIEASADVTDATNVTAAGALMDSELTSIASVKALDQGVATTDSPTFVGLTTSGEITANGGIALGDNDKATFGAGDDLQIYHDGSDSFVKDTGTGDLYLQGSSNIFFRKGNGNEVFAHFADDGACKLRFDNSTKLATTSTGIDVTGAVNSDTLDVTGSTGTIARFRDSGNGIIDIKTTGTANSDPMQIDVNNRSLAFATNNTERFRISSDGSLSTPTLGTSNVRFGVNAGNSIASGGNYNVVVGDEAGTALTVGDESVAVGFEALMTVTSGSENVGVGYRALKLTTGNSNVAVGKNALATNSSASNNTAVGTSALTANTTGTNNVAVGATSLDANTTGSYNNALGKGSLGSNTTGANNTALGEGSLNANTTASNNTGVGYYALLANTTGDRNVAMGTEALDANTTADGNTAVGYASLSANTTAEINTAIGFSAMKLNTTGGTNTAVGANALYSNTTASNNTAVGSSALFANTTGDSNTAVGANSADEVTTGSDNTSLGFRSLASTTTGANNVAIGSDALRTNTTGYDNTAVGVNALVALTTGYSNTAYGKSAGSLITTGVSNTILGRYDGNQGGLDIRTSNNNIVLSDGAGNLGFYVYQNTNTHVPLVYSDTTSSAANVHIATGGRLYRSTSSARYKNTINDAPFGLAEAMALRPVTYKGNNDGDTVFGGLIAEEVHDAGLTEFVQYNDDGEPDSLAYGNMVSLCIKAIQEQQALIESLTARIETLEG
jgi:hypothetical protein